MLPAQQKAHEVLRCDGFGLAAAFLFGVVMNAQ